VTTPLLHYKRFYEYANWPRLHSLTPAQRFTAVLRKKYSAMVLTDEFAHASSQSILKTPHIKKQ